MNRKSILKECPEEFKAELVSFLDSIEDRVNEIHDKLLIENISHLSKIEDAYNMAGSLCDDLY